MADIIEATDKNLDQFNQIINGDKIVLVEFWADWSGECRSIAPVLDEMSKEYDQQAVIVKVKADENPNLTTKYNIKNIPTFLYFKDGELVDLVCTMSKSVLSSKLLELL